MRDQPDCDAPIHVLCPGCETPAAVPADGTPVDIICTSCGRRFTGAAGPSSAVPAVPLKTWTKKQAAVRTFGIGVLLLLFAALFYYWAIYEPLEKMRNHEKDVSYSLKMIFFLPMFALLGIGFMVAGLIKPFLKDPAPRPPGPVKPKTALVLILAVPLLAPGWFLYSWFKDEMAKSGYYDTFGGPGPKVVPVPKIEIPKMTRPDFDALRKQQQESIDNIRKRLREETEKNNR
jgi:hypothetical protein